MRECDTIKFVIALNKCCQTLLINIITRDVNGLQLGYTVSWNGTIWCSSQHMNQMLKYIKPFLIPCNVI